MGLDMFLTKEIYIGSMYKHRNVKCDINITVNEKQLKIPTDKIGYINIQVMTWRKSNQIHNWFVQNCQGGVDDCQKASVSESDLQLLLETCKEVMADHSKASELLPTTSGFFFGSTDYDEYYYDEIKETIQVLEDTLKEDDYSEIDYYYQSSW